MTQAPQPAAPPRAVPAASPSAAPSTRADDSVSHVRTRREWVVLAVGVVVLAALCIVAGRWQWHRHVDRNASIQITVANYDAEPVPLSDLLAAPGDVLAVDEVWRPVTMTGVYRPAETVLLRNRPVASTPGFHVLVPFEVTSPEADAGIVLIVDRGFVPMGSDGSSPDAVPAPQTGVVTVTARLQLDEAPSSRGAPAGQTQAINTDGVLAQGSSGGAWAKGRTVGAYAALMSEDPAATESLFALNKPDTMPGSHLSYTFQWFVFAAGAVGGFLILLRRERREGIRRTFEAAGPPKALPADTPDDVAAWIAGAAPASPSAREVARKRGRSADEDAEDADLDAQGYL